MASPDEMRLDDLLAYQLALGEDYEAFLASLLNTEDGQSLLRVAEAWPALDAHATVEQEERGPHARAVPVVKEEGGAEAPGGRAGSPLTCVECPTTPGASQLSATQTAQKHAPCASASSGEPTASSVITTPLEALMEVDGPAPPEAPQHMEAAALAPPAATAAREQQQQEEDGEETEEEAETEEEESSSGGGDGHRVGHRRPSKLCRLCGAVMLGGKCVGQDKRGRCKYVWEHKGMAAFHECGLCWECRDEPVPGKGYVCTTNQHLTFAFKYTKDRATGKKRRLHKCQDCSRRKKY